MQVVKQFEDYVDVPSLRGMWFIGLLKRVKNRS